MPRRRVRPSSPERRSRATGWIARSGTSAALDPSGPDGAPRLLAIAADGSAPQGVVRLRILRRDRSWEPDDELSLDLRATGVSGVGVPWLIGLGATRFAVISTTPSEERSSVVLIGTDAGPGRSRLAELARTTMDFPIDDAGAADVDGDGTIELVLASARSDRSGGACRGSQVAILDEGLTRTGGFEVTGRRLAGGVLGQWDDAPGADLLAYAYPDCPAAANPATDRGLIAVRLSDGATIVERASGGQAKAPPGSELLSAWMWTGTVGTRRWSTMATRWSRWIPCAAGRRSRSERRTACRSPRSTSSCPLPDPTDVRASRGWSPVTALPAAAWPRVAWCATPRGRSRSKL
ncbi:MAG: hypothetical protein WKF78_12635 [Candidatus Limnocylindrales bacterium]